MKHLLLISLLIFGFITPVYSQGHDHSAHESSSTLWTCSMHPQIKLPEPGKCPICGMNLIPLSMEPEDGGANMVSLRLSSTSEKLAQISTTKVKRKSVMKEVRMVGMLDYDETRLTHITAWVPGRLDRMFVDYTGIRVNRGDHMIELYSPELISAQEELIQGAKSLKRLGSAASSLVKRSTEQSYKAAREKLRLLGLTERQVKEIEARGQASDRVTIYAPTGGVVVEKSATEGMYVQTGTRVYSIADLSTLWLHLDAYESDLPWLRYNQDVEFSTQAIPGKTFHGTISFISPVLNQTTRTTRVRVNVDNSKGSLKPGLFVNGIVKARVYGEGKVIDTALKGKYVGPMHPEVIQDTPGTCPICGMDLVPAEELGYITEPSEVPVPLVVPVSAPLLTGKRAIVYVKDPEESRYFPREIVLGPRAGDYYIVEDGLKEGELVVTNGAFKIDADLQIKGMRSMMNPEGIKQSEGHNHGNSAKENDGNEHNSHSSNHSKKPKLSNQDTLALKNYLDLSEALAADDLTEAIKAITSLKEASDNSNLIELKSIVNNLPSEFKEISKLRESFGTLSEVLLGELKGYSLPEDIVANKAHCPMALGGKGADWIQRGSEVRNPYYGASMLSCGSIEGEL